MCSLNQSGLNGALYVPNVCTQRVSESPAGLRLWHRPLLGRLLARRLHVLPLLRVVLPLNIRIRIIVVVVVFPVLVARRGPQTACFLLIVDQYNGIPFSSVRLKIEYCTGKKTHSIARPKAKQGSSCEYGKLPIGLEFPSVIWSFCGTILWTLLRDPFEGLKDLTAHAPGPRRL